MIRDHLSLQEIEWLAEGLRDAYGMPMPGREAHLEEARRHVGECESCHELVQVYEGLHQRLGQLNATREARLGPNCPSEDEWWRLAAGLLPESQAAEALEHSINCDACGLLLRQAVQDFAEEASEQEITELSALPSAQIEWQRSLAQRLRTAQSDGGGSLDAETRIGRWPRGLADRFAWQLRDRFRYTWAYAAAALVLLIAVTWIIQKRREPSIDQLIARAYTQQRPFEPRIADSAYGPLRQERAGEHSSLSQPTDLLRAKYLLKEKLASRPDDEALLAAKGRIELLEGHYEEAIRTFGHPLDAEPDSAPLLIDLATAYFQRAEAGDRAIDYGQAVELLSRALEKRPDDPVALFNRAIALEKLYVYNEAIRDWEHYLRVDSRSEWAAEARRRLEELQKKMKAREKPAALLKTDPALATPLLRAHAGGHWTDPVPWATSLDEEYLDLAVSEWLPSLYVPAGTAEQKKWRREPAVWDALNATADVLRIHHNDRWLDDLLREAPGESVPPSVVRQFAAALDSLAGASKANAAGDPDTAYPLAKEAARSFRAAGSTAGFLRAREEVINSLLGARRIQECIKVTGQQLGEAAVESYVWLKGQAILWNATCWGAAGDPGLAQRLSERALELTKNADYADQYMESVLFASGFLQSGERHWQQTLAGLQDYWADLHNPLNGYEFFYELGMLAEDAQKRHLARLSRREALGAIERTHQLLFQAVAHYDLARTAENVHDLPEAETELRMASQQFAALRKSPTSQLYRMACEIHLAAVEIQQGRLDSAAGRLEQARLNLTDMSDTATTFSYYGTLGQLHLRGGNLPKAEQALWSAVRVGEVHLRSLQSDTDRLAWERDTAAVHRALVELYVQWRDATTRALEVWEWYRALASRRSARSPSSREGGTGESNLRTGSLPLSLVKGTLPILNHETVVSFALLPSGVAAWAFDDRRVNFTWVAITQDELARRVNHFAYLCSDPSSDLTKLRQEGRNLYDLLFRPFEPHLEPTRLLLIEPDSVLSTVPWPALVDSSGEYLGSRFAIVVSPGLGYWRNLRSPATISSEQTALVVGMPALAARVAARFPSLPDASREAQDIAARFRDSHLLSGKEVSASAIRQELLRSKVFHFAGHAVSGAIESGLLLASPDPEGNDDEPTLLSVGQLEEAVLQQLQLVVLSACATAETEKEFTEADTLVAGFLRAGVPHVVASRWPVDSYTTQQTMTEFYAALFDGLMPAKALQQVANRLRLKPPTTHPFYWAAFAVYGR